ncbi:ABC transporter permease [Coralloluteibacterium stylophorae]|uniref:ABC transporter permease n=1 Tax=Coralloluteibacterium stylophorae TaxID=1776034 RepID=A0A8J7VTX4_9GAMM|nr:ABC transporter permease [Coralloluteibacterium stylophorae]MBS7458967.1 ABC transporter permease [Coralloluteibacterium stylophorae]
MNDRRTGSLTALGIVLAKELRDLVRDRRTVVIALLLGPLILPTLMLGIGGMIAKRMSTQMEKPLELPIIGAERAPNLVAWLEGQNVKPEAAPADPEAAIRTQAEEVILRIDADYADDWRATRPALVELMYDASRQDSDIPVRRTEALLQAYGETVGTLRLVARGVSPTAARPLLVSRSDLSTPESRRGMALSFLPYLLILSAFLGGAYLVIDVTAGERERQSLEPLLATPAARGSIMSGKIAAAVVFGLVSLTLTLVAFKIGAQLAPGLGRMLDVSLLAMVKMLAVLVPLLLLGCTLITLIAASVKSVKEAQSYLSLLMFLPIVPTIVLMVNPVKNQLWMFAVPLLSQNQMLMKILRGETVTGLEWLVYAGAGMAVAGVLWLLAARLYHREKLAVSA